MFCLLLSQPDESLLCALSLGPVSSQQMLQQRASCLFYLCRSDVINIRFAQLRLLCNKTVGQIRCMLLQNPQLYCKTASPGSKKSSLQLSGYKVSAWIKGIAFPPPPPSSLAVAFTSCQLIDVANPVSPLFTFQLGYPGNRATSLSAGCYIWAFAL